MTPIQKRALLSLVAKKVLSKDSYDTGAVALTDIGQKTAQDLSDVYQGEAESVALGFMSRSHKLYLPNFKGSRSDNDHIENCDAFIGTQHKCVIFVHAEFSCLFPFPPNA